MKILMVNKFLYKNGGSETYMFKLGEYLEKIGNEVQYFGMEHPDNCVSNAVGAYTEQMDFHSAGALKNISLSLKTVYSKESMKKIRLVLDDFKPNVVHLNNFNYQLTPSIIVEIRNWEKETGHRVKIIYTAHDYQLICPNHMLYNPNDSKNCEKCITGSFAECLKGKCVHSSTMKSAIGMIEATYWNNKKIYEQIDTIICCSEFMKSKLDTNPILKNKTVVMHNFIDRCNNNNFTNKKDYVLYFGRFSQEKGIKTLLKVCKSLPDVHFVFAGTGPLEHEVSNIENIKNVGFKSGEDLKKLISEAKFCICPSEWYENCPLSVMESISMGTPVIGADIGGIPELIDDGKNGCLFESGNEKQLSDIIRSLYYDNDKILNLTQNAVNSKFFDVDKYSNCLLKYYSL
ncbi:MAG: glycosyltransferase family 4 protein [Clostridiales bacterium]|nr:glycosyltransferase family 4 protein [Clostridiales bacterium]